MKILIIEDEHKIAQSIKKGLEQERYIVDVCFTGNEGYDLASTEHYDVIILDIMLPDISGIEICKKLRSKRIHTPVLVLTARGQIRDKVEGLDSGADDYLTKPFSFEELLARIRAIVRRPQNTIDNSILEVGDLKLNTRTYEVIREGVEIKLSSKEYSLLEYFMKHPGIIFSKDQIISHVWDYDSDILPNTVEVYIRNLRNKIDIPFKNKKPLIETVRGFGYKLINPTKKG